MTTWYWIFIAHTGIWAVGAVIANLFSPEAWSKSTLEDKFRGYLTAEAQLFRALATIWHVRKRLIGVWVKKWKARRSRV